MSVGHQFMRFSLVGAIGTAGHYALLFLLMSLCEASAVVASVLGSIVGACINYVLNYKFTFSSQADHKISLPKFMLVALVGALVNLGVMWLGVNTLRLNYIYVQLFATSLVLALGFVLNRVWTFRAAIS